MTNFSMCGVFCEDKVVYGYGGAIYLKLNQDIDSFNNEVLFFFVLIFMYI
jgi:hypothetical protein